MDPTWRIVRVSEAPPELLATLAAVKAIEQFPPRVAADEASLADWLTADRVLARFVALDAEGVARGHSQVTSLHAYTADAVRAVMAEPEQRLLEIGKLFVHPDHRRSGAGAALLDAATHAILEHDRTPCVVVVREWAAARRLYQDKGFSEAARFDGKDGVNLVMVRRSS